MLDLVAILCTFFILVTVFFHDPPNLIATGIVYNLSHLLYFSVFYDKSQIIMLKLCYSN